MAEETLFCPSCNQKVRVPEEMLGQPVQCPLCRLVFTAPTRGGTPAPPSAIPPGEGWPHGQPLPTWQPPPSTGAIKGPAIALLVTGLLGLLVNSMGIAVFGYLVAGGQKAVDDLASAYPPGFMQDLIRVNYGPDKNPFNLTFQIVFFAISAVITAAAVQMLRMRGFWLAVVGSILAIVNINSLCCCLGAPFGIWSLVVLFQPAVRQAFEQRSGPV